MKRSLKRVTITAAAAVITTASLTAIAWSPGHRGDHAPDPDQMVERLSRHLDLSDDQETEIQGILGESFSSAGDDHQRMETLRAELEGQVANFDAGAAQQAADEIGVITSRMVFRRASTQASIYQVLDEDQREEFEAFQDKRQERKEGRQDQRFRQFH